MKLAYLTTILLCLSFFVQSQDIPCGAMEMIQNSINENPEKQHQLDELESFTENFIPTRDAIYVIPVVFHVIHNNGPENITVEQIEDALRVINRDFNKENADTSDVIPEFADIIGDMQVEFRLAKKDPNGNCTNGVTKTVSELTYNGRDGMYNLINWNSDKYMNVWVVNYIEDAGAFAYYPGSAPNNGEGIVCRYTQFGSVGMSGSSNFAERTMTHEIGHWLNLRHTWGNTNDVAVDENCWYDDNVNDTPTCRGVSQNCNLSYESCGSLDNVQNYMDYASCTKMFTNGQKTRAHAALNSTAGGRYYLWQESNLLNTGTSNNSPENHCEPIADFGTEDREICEGDLAYFYDLSYNADFNDEWSYEWTFEDGSPSTSSLMNPEVVFLSSGNKNVSLSVTTSGGTNMLSQNSFMDIKPVTGGEIYPFSESFEYANFPQNEFEVLKDWEIISDENTTWERINNVSVDGDASLGINLQQAGDSTIHQLISPTVDFTQNSGAIITFKYAYAKRTTGSNDRLRIQISTNCGKSWLNRMTKYADDLTTNSGSPVGGTFTPNDNQWEEMSVNLGPASGDEHVLIKIEILSDGGNYFYIDNINFGDLNSSIENNVGELQLTPTNGALPYVNTIGLQGRKHIQISNSNGQIIRQFEVNDATDKIGLAKFIQQELASGIYHIVLENNGIIYQAKFPIIK